MALFKLGQTVSTPGALAFCEANNISPLALMRRHQNGDFGDVDEMDARSNTFAIQHDERILSSYKFPAGKVWCITEWDRSVTTLLLPSEY